MARKDVDLVIRAKDEAAGVVDRITKALNEFIDAQTSLDSKASKTETSLGRLGTAVNSLDKALAGLDAGKGFGPQMDAAAAAVVRLEKAMASSRQEVSTLARDVARSDAITSRYTAKLDGATAALARQKIAVAAAKVEQRALVEAYEKSVAAQGKIAERQAQLPGLIERQSQAVDKTVARYRELSFALEATEKPSQSLVSSFNASQRALDQQRAKLAELTTEYADIGGKLRVAEAAVTIFAAQSEQAAGALGKQERALAKISENYTDLGQKSRVAIQNQRALDGALDKATDGLNRQVGALDKANNNYAELAVSAAKFKQALAGTAAAGTNALGSQIVDQGLAVQQARKEFEALSAAVRNLKQDSAVMSVFRAETKETAREISFAAQRAEEAQMKFLLQQESLQRLGQAYAGVTGDVRSVAAAQAAFAGEQQRLAAALQATSDEGFRQRQAIRELDREAKNADGSVRRLGNASRSAAEAAERQAQATSQAAEAYRRLFGDTRQSLGVTQRLRGEVLSLIAAYGGFYGVINILGQVVEAYQTIEAAQARLNVANNGDISRSAEDLEFLRRTADRLGIDFGALATEYSKFAIATQGTNLQGEKTRKIFTSVAEAARVNRTSTAEMSGVFVALTQIVSKGAVQMEELRQQLGDRLPGALQIMADGLGVTTAELIKMMEAGEVTSDALVPFAEELDRRFGPGLGEALEGTTVAMGRLKNAAFQALLAFGEAGFIEAFTDLINDLTETLQSADFQTFIGNLSGAFAVLADALAFVARNFQLFFAATAGFAALKLTPLVVGLVTDFGRLALSLVATKRAADSAYVAMAATGSAANAAAVGTSRFGAALALIRANPVGLLLTVAASAAALWVSEADKATEALVKHKEIVDQVRQAYDDASGSVEGWRLKVEGLTVTEAEQSLDALREGLQSAVSELDKVVTRSSLSAFTGPDWEYRVEIDKLIASYKAGELSAAELRDEIDKVNQKFDDGSDANERYGERLVAAIKPMVDLERATAEAELVVDALTGTTEDAAAALDELAGVAEDSGKALDESFNAAMKDLRETVDKLVESAPKAKSGVDEIAAGADELQKHYNEALAAARQLPDAIMRAAAEQAALNGLAEGYAALQAIAGAEMDSSFGSYTNGTEASAALLREFEGFRATPYYDVNAFRVGFGSDTITLSDGSIQKVVEGMTVSVADANRDLIRRIGSEFMPIAERAAGASRFASFTPQQQAALTSIAYNYGEIPARIAEAVRTGTTEEIADAIRGLGEDNGGINRGRRFREAALFESTAGVEGLAEQQVQQDAERAKLAEEERKLREEEAAQTKERLADGEFEIEQQNRILEGKEREAAIQEAIREAKAENANITDEELAKVAEQAGKLFDLEQQQKNVTTAKERAQKAEEEVNNLLAQRQALMQQMEMAQKAGDTELQDELKTKITEINAELVAAIENAKQLWGAVGGSEADAAIAKLTTATMEAQNFSVAAQKNYLDWSRVADLFTTGLASAFDRFAQAVAEGQSVGDAAKEAFLQFAADFLRQIAQMIIQQAIFNALQGAFGGTKFGSLIGLGHTGGIVGSQRVGSGNMSRKVNPAMFAGAMRYHTGGIVGLAPNEVPIIAKKGEAMLTEDDPFHPANRARMGTGGGTTEVKTRIINAIDPASFLAAALASTEGEKVILNWLNANSDAVRGSGG